MGCSNSTQQILNSQEQPVKNYPLNLLRHQTKVIQIIEPINHPSPEPKEGTKIQPPPKNQQILKKQSKIKVTLTLFQQLKNNKGFIELSIETSYCVNKLLNTLAQNQILEDRQVKNLLSKNNQALATKQNRYKNLEARQQKMESELKKQLEKNQKNINLRNTLPAKSKQHSQKLTNKRSDSITQLVKPNNKENIMSHSNSIHSETDYKSKFNNKIDQFRIEVNTLVPKPNGKD